MPLEPPTLSDPPFLVTLILSTSSTFDGGLHPPSMVLGPVPKLGSSAIKPLFHVYILSSNYHSVVYT
jgi:hypothetical protein